MSNGFIKNNSTIESLAEFDDHYSISFLNDTKSGLKGFIVLHRKNDHFPSFGATRLWHYHSETEALKDALRLSKLMSYKSALAGLKAGGAKGVIMLPRGKKFNRNNLLKAYAKRVDLLKGSFITGTDVGLYQEDLKILKKITPYIVGFNGYTTELTAYGVYCAIETALSETFGSEEIAGKNFAIQGVGKVGEALLSLLYPKAKKVFITDINQKTLENVAKKYKRAVVVAPEKIHKQKADVFCPCALSGAINSKNISQLHCQIIAGGANNQLEDDSIGALLHRLKILYVPDYVANAGGLIAVVDEYNNDTFNYRSVEKKVLEIKKRLVKIFAISKKENKPTNIVANELAVKVFNHYQ